MRSSRSFRIVIRFFWWMQLKTSIEGTHIVGRKCVSANEMQFLGHFPQQHLMPGVLIVEALAQTGCVLLLSKEENKGKLAVLCRNQ